MLSHSVISAIFYSLNESEASLHFREGELDCTTWCEQEYAYLDKLETCGGLLWKLFTTFYTYEVCSSFSILLLSKLSMLHN